MREILFRAWYNNKELLDVDTIFFNDDGTFHVYLKRGRERFGQGKCDVVIEQFTGLLDTNGVKIFEGDIVRIYNHYDGNAEEDVETFDHVAVWDEGYAQYGFKRYKSDDYCTVPYIKGYNIKIEVVGNIHETAK